MPDSGTLNVFGFVTSRRSDPLTPPRPAAVTLASRTCALGLSIECMNNEHPHSARQAAATRRMPDASASAGPPLTARNCSRDREPRLTGVAQEMWFGLGASF